MFFAQVLYSISRIRMRWPIGAAEYIQELCESISAPKRLKVLNEKNSSRTGIFCPAILNRRICRPLIIWFYFFIFYRKNNRNIWTKREEKIHYKTVAWPVELTLSASVEARSCFEGTCVEQPIRAANLNWKERLARPARTGGPDPARLPQAGQHSSAQAPVG